MVASKNTQVCVCGEVLFLKEHRLLPSDEKPHASIRESIKNHTKKLLGETHAKQHCF